ncbi:ribonuclease H-like domain-containing protein [Tanacetum coccineum]
MTNETVVIDYTLIMLVMLFELWCIGIHRLIHGSIAFVYNPLPKKNYQYQSIDKVEKASYEVDKYLYTPEITSSSLAPLTPEELKIDKIVLSWFLFTLFDSLRARLVVAHPRSRTNALKAELRSIKLGDQSMESYFQKIDSLINILTSLGAHVNDEDVVHYAIEGLPKTYNQVCGYMHWKDTFPDLKMARSLLITEEMRLKSKALALPVDSSSPMVLVAESGNNRRSSSMPQVKSSRPCFNYAKGTCRYGKSCRYVHDPNARPSNANKGSVTSGNSTNDLLTRPSLQIGPVQTPPPGFQQQAPLPYYYSSLAGPSSNTMAQFVPLVVGPVYTPTGHVPTATTQHANNVTTGSVLPHQPIGHPVVASTTETLHDTITGAWNMDTGASSHLNNSVYSLSTVLNSCMYSSVSVGDGYSIPVTNTGHNILPTPSRSLHLNNDLITPHIMKKLIFVCQFVRDNDCTIEFDSFGYSVEDFDNARIIHVSIRVINAFMHTY